MTAGWVCVPIRAGLTVRGTRFLPEALERAVPLFEGAPVHVEHRPLLRRRRAGLIVRKGDDRPVYGQRQHPEPVGRIVAPRYQDGAIVATLEPVGDYLPALFEAAPEKVAMSIVPVLAWSPGQRGVFGAAVEITGIRSVDISTRPEVFGAAGGFVPLAEGRPIPADLEGGARLLESALSSTAREVWLP